MLQYNKEHQKMATDLDINFRVRTEQSEEFSISSLDYTDPEHSIDSVSFFDEAISLHIQNLHRKQQQQRGKSRGGATNRSLILIKEGDGEQKRKSMSMRNQDRGFTALPNVPQILLTKLLSHRRCLNLAKNDLYNRAYGAMFGFLIGDSMGAYNINRQISETHILEALVMEGGGVMNLKSGEATDEWEICLALSEGLNKCKGIYNHSVIAGKYLEWIESNPNDLPVLMGIAFSDIRRNRRCGKSLDNSTLGDQLLQSSTRNYKQQSALGLIRILPLVIWGINLQEYEFNYLIKEEMKLINPNEFVIETALIFANLLKCILTTGDHMLAYHQAAQSVYNFGSEKLVDLWNGIEENKQTNMTNLTANNLKFPFLFAINEMLEIDSFKKDPKKQFIQAAVRVLSKGYNTDTNCSISLGLVGAIIGYNNIPSYFRHKILNAQYKTGKNRGRDYNSQRVVDVVAELIKSGPTQLSGMF